MPPTTPELLQALNAWLASQAPGLVPSHLTVHFHNHAVPLQLPLAAALPSVAVPRTTAPGAEANGDDKHGPMLHPCVRDILLTLREADEPLTKTRLLEEMAQRGREWSHSSVCKHLAELMADGTIENPEDARQRGYRFPESVGKTKEPNGQSPKRFSQCISDILSVLEAAGMPLTTSRIMTALEQAGKEWSLSTVSHHLGEMVKEGTLTNPVGVHPRGYRLPQWGERAEAEQVQPEALTSPPEETLAESIYAFVVRRGRSISLGEILGRFPDDGKSELRAALQELVDNGRLRYQRSLYRAAEESE